MRESVDPAENGTDGQSTAKTTTTTSTTGDGAPCSTIVESAVEDPAAIITPCGDQKSPATDTNLSNISNNCSTKRSLINTSRRSSSICSNLSDERSCEGGFNNVSNTTECDEDGDDFQQHQEQEQGHRQHKDQKRPYFSDSALVGCTKDELVNAYHQLQTYIDSEDSKHHDEVTRLKSSVEDLKAQQLEGARRENLLVMRLSTKEQEMEEYIAQINELKSAIVPSGGGQKTTLVDPAVNFIIQKMKKELQETKKKLEDTQNDLAAWKFTPDSNTGKRLMAKCRMLYLENEELGKVINGGRVAKLETDLALQKKLNTEMKKSRLDMEELVHELDEDVEGMQSTIVYLQQQIRERKPEEEKNQNQTPVDNNSCNDTTDNDKRIFVTVKELCSQCKSKVSGTSDTICNSKFINNSTH